VSPPACAGWAFREGVPASATIYPAVSAVGPRHLSPVVPLGGPLGPCSVAGMVGETLFLGDNLLEWLLLALGGALALGNGLALVRPPSHEQEGDLERAPVGRSLLMGGVGLIAAIWALASLTR